MKADLGRKLLQIKEELEKKKSQRSEFQGELKSLMKQLEEFGAKTVEQANKIINKWAEELQDMELVIQKKVQELEQELED